MENDFLANLQQESETVNFELSNKPEEKTETPAESEKSEKGTPTESPPENKPEKDEKASPAEGKKEDELKPKEGEKEVFHAFHEHPRWIVREKELKELRSKVEEYEEFKERVDPILQKIEKSEEKSKTPQWFISLFGDDQNLWNQYQESSKEDRQRLREEILTELKPDLEIIRETKRQKELNDWANKEWEKLKEDTEVQKELKTLGLSLDKVQGEISAVMSKYLPSDNEGNISVKKSYEIWKETHKLSPPKFDVAEKKKIGAIDKSQGEGEKKDYKTSADFKGLSIADLTEQNN